MGSLTLGFSFDYFSLYRYFLTTRPTDALVVSVSAREQSGTRTAQSTAKHWHRPDPELDPCTSAQLCGGQPENYNKIACAPVSLRVLILDPYCKGYLYRGIVGYFENVHYFSHEKSHELSVSWGARCQTKHDSSLALAYNLPMMGEVFTIWSHAYSLVQIPMHLKYAIMRRLVMEDCLGAIQLLTVSSIWISPDMIWASLQLNKKTIQQKVR